MFRRILKKDLKRKKTMNIILLLFVMLCAMFAAASVNNIIAVTGGIDHYFEKAEVPDITVDISTYTPNDYEERILALPSVKDAKTTDMLIVLGSKNFKMNGVKLTNFINPALFFADDEMYINFFDEDNNIIKNVEKGCFYANSPFLRGLDIKKGDMVEVNIGECSVELKYMGRYKGALFSSTSDSNPYLLIDRADFDVLDKEDDAHMMYVKRIYINGADKSELDALAKDMEGIGITTRDEFRSLYLYDMIAATIMMIISIVLMVTAFVMLKFSIGFTIEEDLREIGVMKAVGLQNSSIRGLYMIKYLALSAVGAVIGFVCSIPLTEMMLAAVSENMVLGSEHSMLMGLVSVACVVALILLFCYTSTRKVRKLSPIDAVRSGQTGERFGKRSILHLGRSKLPATGFMALNDVLSAPKQFSIITLVFSLCLLLITIMSNFALTLSSKDIYPFFDITDSDLSILDTNYCKELFIDQSSINDLLDRTEKKLADNGMPCKCTMTSLIQLKAHKGDKQAKLVFLTQNGETDEQFTVDEGTLPMRDDEIMLTISAMKDLDAEIGDRITAEINGEEREFIVTGRHSSFQSHSAYLNRNYDFGHLPSNGFIGIQIDLDGQPDEAKIESSKEKIKELLDTEQVYTISEMIARFTGISDTLNTIKYMMIVLTVIVTAMITVLMERSFISKEKSEIALMKAIGISDGSIIAQHTLRFVIVSIAACILSSIVLMPLSDLLMNRVCLLIGDVAGMNCTFNGAEVFAAAPALLITMTVISAWLTALYTKTITSSDTAALE
ncbi:FtsX-like permease family protein [uncultured Ruminococcus sp.]|uniref:FtsX-like permease family protein n=1 Tax=uncultured Ruminococcus sp. TaxID=165186 RepID=UPI0025D2ED3B|nr:FtsX-like permease family protein [uncultured Ruminococcus sp.]